MKHVADAASEILACLQKAATASDDEQIVQNLSGAFAALVRGHGVGQLHRGQREAVVAALFRAEDAARSALSTRVTEASLHQGCLAMFGLVNAWAEPVGSIQRRDAAPAGLSLIARMIANDLDTLCASMELARLMLAAVPAPTPSLADMPLSATAH